MNRTLFLKSLLLIFVLFIAFWLSACGAPGPPLPPERPGRVNATQVTATQRGSQIILNWTTPPVRRSSGKLERIDIYRMSEQRSASPTSTTVDNFRESASVVGF